MGAWIETRRAKHLVCKNEVAPYVGAWIETSYAGSNEAEAKVAPYVGAWIETEGIDPHEFMRTSHPTWVRGLKPV